MTHNDLLEAVNSPTFMNSRTLETPYIALRAVLELHKPEQINPTYLVCTNCYDEESGPSDYPCDTIQAIEKELQ
jgi:hypothetical protein